MGSDPSFDAAKKLKDALARVGLAPPGIARELRPGAVCSLNDAAIAFPTERLPDAADRGRHDRRRAIVMQCKEWAGSKRPLTLLVVPCSASHRGAVAPWEVEIPDGTPGFTKEYVVASPNLVQAVLKSDVLQVHGHVDEQTLRVLRDALARVADLAGV